MRKETENSVAQCTWSVFHQFIEISFIKVDIFPDNIENIKTTMSESEQLTCMSLHCNYLKNKNKYAYYK